MASYGHAPSIKTGIDTCNDTQAPSLRPRTMELSLNKNDPINTVFMTPDGRPMYHVNTASKVFGTGDTKIMNVWEKTTDIGMIEWHSWSDSVILVGRRRVTPDKSGTFSS